MNKRENLLFLVICLSLFCNFSTFAQEREPVNIELIPLEKEVKAGGTTNIKIKFRIEDGIHIYSFDAEKTPTKIELLENKAVQLLGFANFPEPVKKNFSELGGEFFVYEGTIEGELKVRVKADAPSGLTELNFVVSYFACTENSCYPKKEITKSISINIIGQKAEIEKVFESGALILFGIALIQGIISAFTPCVLPIIPLTIAFFASSSKAISITRFNTFIKAIFFVLGIAIVYTSLGILSTFTKLISISQVQTSKIIGFGFAGLFFILALFLFGILKFQLPSFVQSSAGRVRATGFFGAFLRGAVCSVLFTPCTGPFVIGLLGLVSGGDIVIGFSALFIYSLGLGLPFLILAFFSENITQVLKGGKWQVILKEICGFIFLGASIYFLQFHLPLSITLVLTGIVAILFATYIGAFSPIKEDAIYLTKLCKAIGITIFVFGCFVIILPFIKNYIPGVIQKKQNTKASNEIVNVAGMNWYTSYEKAHRVAKSEKKPMFIDFYTEYCASCDKLDREVFPDEDVQKELKRFVLVKLDADIPENGDLARRLGSTAVPFLVFYNSYGEHLRNLNKGYATKEELLELLKEID